MSEMDETPPVRQQSWTVDGPADIDVTVDVGRVRIDLAEGGEEVRVEVRHEPTAGSGFELGFGGLVSWLATAAGASLGGSVPAAAVRTAEITWQDRSRRLIVRSATELPLRMVPLAVTVSAPASSTVTVRTGAGDVTIDGRAGRATAKTGSGDVRLGPVDGDAEVTTGSGRINLDSVQGRSRLRTGSGSITVGGLHGAAEINSSSGTVGLGEVSADLTVRTGSGDVRIDDARSGRFELSTGSGELVLRVHPGVIAELDLSSGSGRARSDLPVSSTPPDTEAALTVRGRTGSGDVLVTRA